MKKIILTALLSTTFAAAQPLFFVHPMDFDNTEAANYSVDYFINHQPDHSESDQHAAFEALSYGKNRASMDQAIQTACDINQQCDYVSIQALYVEP